MNLEKANDRDTVIEANDPLPCVVTSSNEEQECSGEGSGRWRGFWTAVQAKRAHSNISPRNKINAIALGQLIAFSAASANAASYALSNRYDIQIQLFQLFLMYIILSFHLFCRDIPIPDQTTDLQLSGSWMRLRVPWFVYLAIAVLDVLPNFLILISFRFASLTSTTLLGSLTVPSTMFFSHFILARNFSIPHYVGVCLCIAGGLINGISDLSDAGNQASYKNSSSASPSDFHLHEETANSTSNGYHFSSATGDFLALLAAVLYGLGDTVAEYSIKHIHRQEYLGMLGLFGSILTGLTFPWVEGDVVLSLLTGDVRKHINIFLFLVLSTLFVLFYYVAAAWFYTSSDATLLNLSLQTSNLWAILFSVLTYRECPKASFYMALLFVLAGVVVYQHPNAHHAEDDSHESPTSEVEALVVTTSESRDSTHYGNACTDPQGSID